MRARLATKAIGYVIPPRLVEGEHTIRVSPLLPAAPLTGLSSCRRRVRRLTATHVG